MNSTVGGSATPDLGYWHYRIITAGILCYTVGIESCLSTLGAHAQRGLRLSVCLSVCLCVCRRFFWHYRLRGGPLAIPPDSELREPELGDFPETISFERYAVKTSEKANMHGLPRPGARSVYLGGSGSHNQWHVMLSTTVASPCLTLRGLLAEDHRIQIAGPAHQFGSIAHAQFADGLHFSAFHSYSCFEGVYKSKGQLGDCCRDILVYSYECEDPKLV